MSRYSLHTVGRDRPGIVAAVTGALAEMGCNLEDSRMTILQGQFAIMLVLEAPRAEGPEGIESALRPVAERLGLQVVVCPLPELTEVEEPGSEVVISVHGADHPGIVARIAGEVAAAGGNVVDLSTRLVGDPEAPGYVMVLTVALPPGLGEAGFAARVEEAASEAGVSCVVSPADADLL